MKPSPPPSRKPTPHPTLPPTFSSPTMSPVLPAPTSPPSSEPTSQPATSFPTKKPSPKPTRKPSPKPTPGAGDTRWYPGTSKCLNDGKAPSWMANLYLSQTTCCSSHFSWDYNSCMGLKQQSTYKWYANWALGKCSQDCEMSEGGSCGGLVPGSYVIVHNSAEACCSAHMSYLSFAECKYG